MKLTAFASPLWKACERDKNNLRKNLEYVWFLNGYAYATNGKVLIKQELRINHVQYMELLNGHGIHWTVFKKLMNYPDVVADFEGIKTPDGVLYPYAIPELKPYNFDAYIIDPYLGGEPVNVLGIDYKLISCAGECLYGRDHLLKLEFNGESCLIRVTNITENIDQVAIVGNVNVGR
jgi:hypothetical protein